MNVRHNEIIDTWVDESAEDFSYFTRFEAPEMVRLFWSAESRFKKIFDKYLNLSDVLEVASGAGRHAAQIVSRCEKLTLIDTSRTATKLATSRFADHSNVSVFLSEDGNTLPFEKDRFSAVFSYDAMVHFEPLTIASYLAEIASVLRPGGRAVLHHSNYSKHPANSFKDNPHWRNFMPVGFMEHIANRVGLSILERQAFSWPKDRLFKDKTDGITVLQRPTTR